MASPFIAGVTAGIRQYVKSDPAFAVLSEQERRDVVTQLLMSTADPQVNAPVGDGSFYSPRQQGAGLGDAAAATSSHVYLKVQDAKETQRPVAEWGDGENGWSFTMEVHNPGDQARGFKLDAQALADQVKDGLLQLKPSNRIGHGVSMSFSGPQVTTADGVATVSAPAKGTTLVTVQISVGDEFKNWVANNTPNGSVLDGFVTLTPTADGQVNLSLPFLALQGSWGKAPVFDMSYYEGGFHAYGSRLHNTTTKQMLGTNPLDPKGAQFGGAPQGEELVISRAA